MEKSDPVKDQSKRRRESYLANEPLVAQIGFLSNGAWRMTTVRQHGSLNYLSSLGSAPSGSAVASSAYAYNAVNQREDGTLAEHSCWGYILDGWNRSAILNSQSSVLQSFTWASVQYEYGPFGEVLRATGPMARGNPFRYSTKYQDEETDLLYYGYRYLDTSTGRWLSKDSISERGGSMYTGLRDNARFMKLVLMVAPTCGSLL